MRVHIATWYHTWGEYSGIAGVYTTAERAWAELDRIMPLERRNDVAGCDVEEVELDVPAEDIE